MFIDDKIYISEYFVQKMLMQGISNVHKEFRISVYYTVQYTCTNNEAIKYNLKLNYDISVNPSSS